MEENQNTQLSREEILAISREENKHGDEREKQYYLKANSLAFSVGLFIAGIIIIVTVLTSGRMPAEIFLLICAMQAEQSIVIAVGTRKLRKMYLIIKCSKKSNGSFLMSAQQS